MREIWVSMSTLAGRRRVCAVRAIIYVLLGMAVPSVWADAPDRLPVALGCVPAKAVTCGCSVRISNLACTADANGPHFFTGLEPEDPLLFRPNGQNLELPHATHKGSALKGGNRGRWIDGYGSKEISVSIYYAPASSTCTKSQDDEGCEFTDYSATVLLRRSHQRLRVFTAKAKCGC
jgi:hypothetical protein